MEAWPCGKPIQDLFFMQLSVGQYMARNCRAECQIPVGLMELQGGQSSYSPCGVVLAACLLGVLVCCNGIL